jgi:hypothetical protein
MNGRRGERKAGWEFEYQPLSRRVDPDDPSDDFILATRGQADERSTAAALEGVGAMGVEQIAVPRPLWWYRVRLSSPARATEVQEHARQAGLAVRYAAPAGRASMRLGSALGADAVVVKPSDWPSRAESTDPEGAGCWAQGPLGVNVDRQRFGRGAGTRLAVVDDDAAMAHVAKVDAEVLVHVESCPRSQPHGTLMVGWAVGTRRFLGVAPDASARLYCIPKPDVDVYSLPAAIARAVDDGADVVLCPSYVDGSTSPMLDDALEYAARSGRGGLGAVVVMPAGREASSPPWSTHASWTLGLGEPASDPRVLCIAPGSPGGRWFLWPDRKGRLRPFANRGPAVRLLCPGDDMTHPLEPDKPSHAESSGASAIAAGVVLLVLSCNPLLRATEVATLLRRTARPPRRMQASEMREVADLWDLMPEGRDADGHDAKHGYGMVDAGRACLSASDPLCFALVSMGEEQAARRWYDARRSDLVARSLYSWEVGRWMARLCLVDEEALHRVSVVARHVRLVASGHDRLEAHGTGALTRQLLLLLRFMVSSAQAGDACGEQVSELMGRLAGVLDETGRSDLAERVAWRLTSGLFRDEVSTSAAEARDRV